MIWDAERCFKCAQRFSEMSVSIWRCSGAQRCSEVLGCVQRCSEVLGSTWMCSEVLRGARKYLDVFRGAQRCSEVLGCVQRCSEVLGSTWMCSEVLRGIHKVLPLEGGRLPVSTDPRAEHITPSSARSRVFQSEHSLRA